jgi:3-oxoacyl-(acyl-carrier-protein) synthase
MNPSSHWSIPSFPRSSLPFLKFVLQSTAAQEEMCWVLPRKMSAGNSNGRPMLSLAPAAGLLASPDQILTLMVSGGICVAIGYTLHSFLNNSSVPSSPPSISPSSGDEGQEDIKTESRAVLTPSLKKNDSYIWASGLPILRVVITGVSAALPGTTAPTFLPNVNNIHRIINGESFIEPISEEMKLKMLEKNVVVLKKDPQTGQTIRFKIQKPEENINLCASVNDSFDLSSYGVPSSICQTMDRAVQLSVACGLEALKDAGIVTGHGEGMTGWVLPEHLQRTTGIVYATSFPALDTAISEVTKYFRLNSASANQQAAPLLIQSLRDSLQFQLHTATLPPQMEELLSSLNEMIGTIHKHDTIATGEGEGEGEEIYEFDRKFLFRVLVLGNAQLAQIVKARGPNMQTNAACAGSTQAIALAHDMIQLGRAERMIVIAGDNASSKTLMPWLGNGFRALGAATICADVANGSCPFDVRRSGMILGSGGIGMILESEEGARRRYALALKYSSTPSPSYRAPFKCRLLGSLYSNSAYHGASLDKQHIAEEMERFIATIEQEHHITRQEIARHGVYFSHETSTNSSPTSSCASNELYALRKIFGESFRELLILNTKGFTGHPMGVSYEDVVAVEVLFTGRVPPIANFQEMDPALGEDVKLSRGGAYPCRYAIRFAAGFGSQIALALYGAANT